MPDDDYDEEEQEEEEEEDLFSLSLQELAASSHVLMLPPPPLYDVQEYNDDELYTLLELDEHDPALEDILLRKTQRYLAIGNGAGSQLAQFYLAVYQRLFETQPVQEEEEGEQEEEEEEGEEGKQEQQQQQQQQQQQDNGGTVLQQAVAYSKGSLNPLLKESITRIVSIDSAYREDVENTPSTSFTFNLSEPLKDVVALKLYSVQIPYAWYTINSSFGGNFFYIRGNVPGLNNGNHDIRVEIKSGNYTESQLQDAINAEFDALSRLSQYADLSFGGTTTSFDITTMKITFKIDLKKVYDQSYYRLVFPNWQSPADLPRQTTLAGYLGFNNHDTTTGQSMYPCVSLSSPRTLSATPNATASSYSVNNSNRTFQIVFTTTTTTTTPVTYEVTLRDPTTGNPLDGNYSMAALLRALETGLAKSTFLDQQGSSATLQPIAPGSTLATLVLVLRLNRFTTPNGTTPGTLSVLFPDESGSANKIWTSVLSAFQFPSQQQQQPSQCTEIVAETNMLQTSYTVDVADAVSIVFPCTMAPYNVPYNTYTATVQESANGYLLLELVEKVNEALRRAETATSIAGSKDLNGDQTKLYLDTVTNKLDLRFDITRVFTNSYYAFASQHSYCGNVDITDLSTTNVFVSYFNLSASYVLDPSDVLTIYPITLSLTPTLVNKATGFVHDASARPFVVKPSATRSYPNYNALEDAMNLLFRNYRDPLDVVEPDDNPLSRCTVSMVYDQIRKKVKATLTIVVNKTLTQTHYNVEFRDTTADTVENNFWVKNLFFAQLYTPAQCNTDPVNSALSHVVNTTAIFDNSILVVPYANDRFSFVPYTDATCDLLQHSEYQHTVIVPPGTYSSNQLYAAINAQLDANPVLRGSVIGSRLVDGKSFTFFTVRINQTFSTKDYRLVFYDIAGFTSCLRNASSKSLVTVKWDTTVGWLLGYRESPTYALSDYLAEAPGKSASKYYLPENANVCVLIGDTNVSLNLFNYFLIVLDDYTQNHLNDGLVTTQQAQTVIDVPLETKVTCDPVTGLRVVSAANDPGATPLTAKQLYAAQQKVLSSKVAQKKHSPGPFVKNVFGIIPMKLTGLKQGQTFTELGGTLQQQNRMYFGPVNIHRMSIQLLSDRGNLVDLNNSNWGFVLMAEQLYKKS